MLMRLIDGYTLALKIKTIQFCMNFVYSLQFQYSEGESNKVQIVMKRGVKDTHTTFIKYKSGIGKNRYKKVDAFVFD